MKDDEQEIAFLFQWRNAIFSRNGPPSTTRLVLITISLHMKENGEDGFPTIDTIIERSGLARRTVIEHLKIAEQQGWIIKGYAGYPGQEWKHHIYHPQIPFKIDEGGAEDAPRKVVQEPHHLNKAGAPGAPTLFEGGASDVIKVVQEVHLNSTYNSTRGRENSIPPPDEGTQGVEPCVTHSLFKNNGTPKEKPMIAPIVTDKTKETIVPWSTPITRKPKNRNQNLKKQNQIGAMTGTNTQTDRQISGS